MASLVMGESLESTTDSIEGDSNEWYCREILQKLNNLRHEDSLCDVTLVVEGKEFKAHRNVLAASSPYFCNMFSSDMKEKSQSKILIEAIDSSVMEELLSYLYTGAVLIERESSARKLLFAADYIMVPGLKKIAGEFFLRNLAPSSCISSYQLALMTRSETLKDGAQRFINKNFVRVAKSEDFVNLSLGEVIDLISSDDIEVKAEDEVFQVVLNWVEHCPENRKASLHELLRHVRLSLVKQQYLLTKVLKNDIIKNDEKCMAFIMKAIEMLAELGDQCVYESPRKCLETHVHGVLACGGLSFNGNRPKNTNGNWVFLPDQGRWYLLTSMNEERSGHSITTNEGYVYAIGGIISGHRSAKVAQYNPRINSWAEIASLPVQISSASCVSLNGVLYICGGSGRRDLGISRLVFEYNPATNLWQESAPMIHGRKSLCAVTVNQHIFAIGGKVGSSVITNTVERFDPSCNMWMLVSSMKEKRTFACAATYKNKIYVFGGITGKGQGYGGADSSAECYDTDTDQWQSIASMHVPRVVACSVVVQDIIYVIGGNRPPITAPGDDHHQRMIECYNPNTSEWSVKGEIPNTNLKGYCTGCPVRIPKNLLESLPVIH